MSKEFVIHGVDQKPVPEEFKTAFQALRDYMKKLDEDGVEPEEALKLGGKWVQKNMSHL